MAENEFASSPFRAVAVFDRYFFLCEAGFYQCVKSNLAFLYQAVKVF